MALLSSSLDSGENVGVVVHGEEIVGCDEFAVVLELIVLKYA